MSILLNPESGSHNPEHRQEMDVLARPQWIDGLDKRDQLDTIKEIGRHYIEDQNAAALRQESEMLIEGYSVTECVYDNSYSTPEAKAFIEEVIVTSIGAHQLMGESAVYSGNRSKGADKALTACFKELGSTKSWRENEVPSSAALHNLYDPTDDFLPGGDRVDVATKAIFSEALDGIGIRSRGEAVKLSMIEKFVEYPVGSSINLASLACGAAEVVFTAAAELQQLRPDLKITMHIADADASAIKRAEETFTANPALEGIDLFTHVTNILKTDSLEDMREKSHSGSFDFIDIIGFFEYLQSADHRISRKSLKEGTPYEDVVDSISFQVNEAEQFIKNAYGLLNENGTLCTANMRDTHPNLAFTLDCVRWPYVIPRSLSDFTAIAERGCKATKDTMRLILPGDGVYAVLNIDKTA